MANEENQFTRPSLDEFPVPTYDELEEFHGFAAPMFAKIKANQIETDNLTALRDTLLPKLMSGELDASNIEI